MAADAALPRCVTVRVEVPRGSFAKRGAHGRVEFLSPVPSQSTTARWSASWGLTVTRRTP